MKKIITIMAFLLLSYSLNAQKVGSTSMQFLSVIPSARAAGMGNAYVAIVHGVEGVFWNPAGVALTEGHEFSMTYNNWLFDTYQYALAYSTLLGDIGSIGFQFQYNDYGSFEEAIVGGSNIFPGQEYPYLTGRVFKPYSYVVGLSYAKKLSDRFSTGLSIKYGHESLYDKKSLSITDVDGSILDAKTSANVIIFDFGIHYNTGFKSIQMGASVQNFGPDIKYAKDKSSVPMLFHVGIAADFIGPNSLFVEEQNNRLGLAFDIFQTNDYDQQQHIGIEYEFNNIVTFRAGYKFNYDLEGLTFGFGIKQKLGLLKILLDYSYGVLDAEVGSFGNIHRISIGVGIL